MGAKIGIIGTGGVGMSVALSLQILHRLPVHQRTIRYFSSVH